MSGASEPEFGADEERHATNLELFLDLVFVFAITQITGLLAFDPSWPGIGRVAIVTWLVWWLWSQFTWAGSAVNLGESAATRVLVLGTIPVTLVVAVAIPDAYGSGGRWFGLGYLIVQALVLSMHGWALVGNPTTRASFVRYAMFAAVAPVIVAIGGFLEGDARTVAWIVAGLLNIVGALNASGGDFALNPSHFVERNGLFIIISLGEVLVAIGASASRVGLTRSALSAIVASAAMACVLWWTYFAYIPRVTERALRDAAPERRVTVARDQFTFGHFPIVAGIICYAVVAKHLVLHPSDPIERTDLWFLTASSALILGAYMFMQFRNIKRITPERPIAVVVVGLVALGPGQELPGSVTLGIAAIVLGVAQLLLWRRVRGTLD